MSETHFYFNPNEKGLTVFLGKTESKLMEIAWEHKNISVKTALFHLPEKDKPAYTTVMTILSRMADKNLLLREKDGRSFLYRPALTKKQFLAQKISQIKSCLQQFK